MIRVALSADPGTNAGLALVQHVPGARPRLLAAWEVYGSRPGLWWARALQACQEAAQRVGALGGHPTPQVALTVEEPPVVSRHGALAGDTHGQRSWVGIGRRQGMLLAAMAQAGLGDGELLDQAAWARGWGVPVGKQGDGRHRVAEAGLYVEGAREVLAAMSGPRVVDVAEAILQAGHVARRGG